MKNNLTQHLSDKSWHIVEDSWDQKKQDERESKFTIGNGYVSSRGVLEENPYDSYAGTYIAGIFDNTGAQVTELVNLPNPFDFRIVCHGEKIDNVAMDVLEHKRILDMKNGLLYRRTVFSNVRKKKFLYESLKFLSMSDKHTGVMRVQLTPLDSTSNFTLESTIDASVTNKGMLTEGRKKHFYITEISRTKNMTYGAVQTFQHSIIIGCASHMAVIYDHKKKIIEAPVFKFKLKKNQTACFTKTFSLYTSRRVTHENLKHTVINSLNRSVKKGFDNIIKSHSSAWAKKWSISEIVIKGDTSVKNALRFNTYHMLICGPDREGISIGARTLSGEGYRGHIFWDTEIFILPFFIYNFSRIARNILLYRYNRLKEAKKNARTKGYKGVLFPWESADLGDDVTPTWAKDLDGSIIKITTQKYEQHINADIAYTVSQYYDMTGDDEFFFNYGVEILFETAKFWVSRMELDPKTKKYEIKDVTGPDEFHEGIDNNAYTNMMTRWNLMRAYGAYTMIKQKKPSLLNQIMKKIKIKESEIRKWRTIAGKIKFPFSKTKGLVEAFDGYFKKKDIPISGLDKNFIPTFPTGITPRNVGSTQFVKQADVVMLLYLLAENFSIEEKKANFSYYEKRTLHKSSLSFCTHSVLAAELGIEEKAFFYFFNTLMADLNNSHGNTAEGIHAASLGGTWQAVINGFGGVRIRKRTLNFDPVLPKRWQEIGFNINWHGKLLKVSVFHDKVEIYYKGSVKQNGKKIFVSAYGKLHQLKANAINEFRKPK